MKIYCIAREVWGGMCYLCYYSEDITPFLSKEERDRYFEENCEDNADFQYYKFELEVKNEDRYKY